MADASLFADAAEKQTVEQYLKEYDERSQEPVVSDEYKRLSNKLSNVATRYKTLVKARARNFIDKHRLSMSAAMLSLNKLMRKVFEEELKKREETAESLGVHRREAVPMTHRMRLLYRGERY
ncbi:hypothetical protein JCM9279_004806 [Rhodotorula babjevae]